MASPDETRYRESTASDAGQRHSEEKAFTMNVFSAAWFLGLLVVPSVTASQKTILISDTLAANADRLKVNNPAQWTGRIAGWRFGDYAVATSKQGPVKTTTRQRSTKADSSTSETFSFVLTNATTDSAKVDAARNSTAKLRRSTDLGNGWHLGADEVMNESDSLAASITINRDTSDVWTFFLGVTGAPSYTGFLTHGARRITLVVASSNRDPLDLGGWPALGYEFFEDGRSLGAVQFIGGLWRPAQFVWLDRNLDPRTKLLLAAAMTAVLQVNRRS
jgi:hypothetical protein